MGQGYKQTRIASSSANIISGAGIKLADGTYAYGYWSLKGFQARYIPYRNKIKVEFEAKPSTNANYNNINAHSISGSHINYEGTYLYLQNITIKNPSETITYASYNSGNINGVSGNPGLFDVGYLGSDDDSYNFSNEQKPYFELDYNYSKFQKTNFWIDLDKIKIENTGSQKNSIFSYITQPEGLKLFVYVYQNPGQTEGLDDEAGDGSFAKLTEFKVDIDAMDLEKPKEDYTPRYFNKYYSSSEPKGVAKDYIKFTEPKGCKKLQRGNFNIWLGTSPVSGITPDGATTEHTQMSYADSNWDLEVSVDSGATFSAFESEAVYTFGTDTTNPFTDANSIWFHDEIPISEFDDTTISNMNNCYLGDMVFRYGPSEFDWNNTVSADYFYKIKDNFEDKA
mgnify:CR=1 FL=1